VELAAAAGMTGIHIDRDSLFPAQKQALESGLTELLGTPIESEDARYAYYSLAAATASLSDDHDAASIEEVGARVVNPITLNELSTFERGYGPDGDVISTVEQPDPAFMVNNDTDAPVSATLTLELRWVPGLGKKGPLEITLPDGSTETVQLTDKGVIKTWHLTVPAGVTSISFREPGQPAGSEPALQVLTRQIVDDTTADFLGR
jgi:hypothetical protein